MLELLSSRGVTMPGISRCRGELSGCHWMRGLPSAVAATRVRGPRGEQARLAGASTELWIPALALDPDAAPGAATAAAAGTGAAFRIRFRTRIADIRYGPGCGSRMTDPDCGCGLPMQIRMPLRLLLPTPTPCNPLATPLMHPRFAPASGPEV